PATPSSMPLRNDVVGVGIADQSRASNPLTTSSSAAASRTVRVIGPACDKVPKALGGYNGISPYVGLSATVPVKAAGIRTDPPPSVPIDHAPIPRATAVAEPPLEPPEVFDGSLCIHQHEGVHALVVPLDRLQRSPRRLHR